MGFIVAPRRHGAAQDELLALMRRTKSRLEAALPFAMEPVVYDFAINERGTWARTLARRGRAPAAGLLRPGRPRAGCARTCAPCAPRGGRSWTASAPPAAPGPELAGMVETLFDRVIPRAAGAGEGQRTLGALLDEHGFDREQHERIRDRPAPGADRPGPEPPAGQHGHRGRAAGGRHRP